MVILTANEAFVSGKPALRVDNKLRPGRHLFQLVAVDASENRSNPARLVVEVVEVTAPPPPVRPFDPRILRREPTRPVLEPDLTDRLRIRRRRDDPNS